MQVLNSIRSPKCMETYTSRIWYLTIWWLLSNSSRISRWRAEQGISNITTGSSIDRTALSLITLMLTYLCRMIYGPRPQTINRLSTKESIAGCSIHPLLKPRINSSKSLMPFRNCKRSSSDNQYVVLNKLIVSLEPQWISTMKKPSSSSLWMVQLKQPMATLFSAGHLVKASEQKP